MQFLPFTSKTWKFTLAKVYSTARVALLDAKARFLICKLSPMDSGRKGRVFLYFWARSARSRVQSVLLAFCGHPFSEKMLIRSELEISDAGGSNGGSNFEIRPLEADLVSFEVAMLPEKRARLSRFELKIGPKCE